MKDNGWVLIGEKVHYYRRNNVGFLHPLCGSAPPFDNANYMYEKLAAVPTPDEPHDFCRSCMITVVDMHECHFPLVVSDDSFMEVVRRSHVFQPEKKQTNPEKERETDEDAEWGFADEDESSIHIHVHIHNER